MCMVSIKMPYSVLMLDNIKVCSPLTWKRKSEKKGKKSASSLFLDASGSIISRHCSLDITASIAGRQQSLEVTALWWGLTCCDALLAAEDKRQHGVPIVCYHCGDVLIHRSTNAEASFIGISQQHSIAVIAALLHHSTAWLLEYVYTSTLNFANIYTWNCRVMDV